MGRVGLLSRFLAVLSGLVSVLVLGNLLLSFALPHPPVILDTMLMRTFLAGAALACLIVARRFWSGIVAPAGAGMAGSPLFGRHAAPQVERARPTRLLILVPVAALGLVGLDFAERGAPTPPVVAQGPLVELPPSLSSQPPPDLVAAPKPPAAPPAAPPQDVALAPPETVIPPQTVAPPAPPAPTLPSLPQGHRDAVVWLDLSPGGKYMLSASTDHAIKLWDLAGRQLVRTVGEQKDMARTALFLPDGKRVLTCGDDGEIVLRDLSDGSTLHVFDGSGHGGANKLALSRDGNVAVSGHQSGTVIVWDLKKKTARHVLTGHGWTISSVAITADGKQAVSGDIDGTLKLWDIDAGKLLRGWHGHERGTYGAVFTTDGSHLVTGSGDYAIKLWDLQARQEIRRFDGHYGTVYALAISADGRRLASASLDGTARLWDFETGREIAAFDPDSGAFYAIAFGPAGEIITGGADRSIRIWPAAGGDMLALLPGAPR